MKNKGKRLMVGMLYGMLALGVAGNVHAAPERGAQTQGNNFSQTQSDVLEHLDSVRACVRDSNNMNQMERCFEQANEEERERGRRGRRGD